MACRAVFHDLEHIVPSLIIEKLEIRTKNRRANMFSEAIRMLSLSAKIQYKHSLFLDPSVKLLTVTV